MPQRALVLFGSKWRAHDMRGRNVEVGVAVYRIIDQQMAGQHFAIDTLTFIARTCNRFERLSARVMHNVDRHTQDFRNADRPIRRLSFDFRGA